MTSLNFPCWPLGRPQEKESAGESVQVGAEFACAAPANTTERARVIAIEICEDGIPHVRYTSELHRSDRVCDSGTKTLALPTFKKKFHIV